MRHWNKTGKIKAIFLAIIGFLNLGAPLEAPENGGLVMVFTSLIFGAVAIPLAVKFNGIFSGKEIASPAWNDNPLNLKRPLSFFQFASYFFLTVGTSMLIASAVWIHQLNLIALASIAFGTSTLVGIWWALKSYQVKDKIN